ncbi:XRE family transcriptional regulator [Pseudokineococcus marinus]|uniref:Helix-turn-helix transcriptional regulator n=1 Tax=Pseudokineococcus marinus TaxID=351215 RepID=A0A849BJY1_9ACTN|nr:XRE family transcriptional regulator [Pseudokineococcus marinus]NNH21563.1 helix-turn-helix transcriptional regulator [Pseudokineococcus marinus]
MSGTAPEPSADEGAGRHDGLGALVAGLGQQVRALRAKRGLTLAELAETTGLSASMLSTVERGRTAPSLATLHRLAEGLGVRVTTLLAAPAEEGSPVVRLADQIVDQTPGGVVRRLAVFRPEQDVEVYVDEYPPATSHATRPSQHPGQEHGVVLEGVLEVELPDAVHVVEAGDSISYEAKQAHLLRNASPGVTRAVWVNVRRL